MKLKLKEIFKFLPKSNLKASDGNDDGNFKFYTSSQNVSKRIDKAIYFQEAIIFGNGGTANLHYSVEPFSTTSHCFVAVQKTDKVNSKYVYYYLFGNIQLLERGFKGAGLKNISPKYIENIEIPLFSIEIQNKIVSILDKASVIIDKRNECLRLINIFQKSTFNKIFGDAVYNPNNWPKKELGNSVLILKDGPFGSNLKTEHYTESGVRVIRLQNIGINEFNDVNKQFVSEIHAKKLENFTCLPGDILVGTLGEPNLRACKFPINIEKAINKADCLQIRPNNKVAIDIYLTCLLNHEGMLFLSKNFIKGQTRSRISGTKLAKIKIPIPPLKLQNEFKSIVDKLDLLKSKLLKNELDSLFQSLIQKAFNGQLNFNVDLELDSLINEIDLQKKDNNIKEIAGDIAYLQRLIDKLNTQDFKEKEMYDKAKIVAFQLMNESEDKRRVTQEYDEKTKNIKLTLV